MRRLGILGLVIAAIACCSCDSGGGAAEVVNTGKSETKQVKAGGKVQNGGVADLEPDVAPAGVKTGLPSGGGK